MSVSASLRQVEKAAEATSTPLLSLVSVSKTYPGVRALGEVSFEVRAGEVHGLVGENGAGKSTLMAIAAGVLRPDSGLVEIAGTSINADPNQARNLGFAIVRQEPSLMPDLTVAENLYLGVASQRRPAIADMDGWATQLLGRWSDDISFLANDRVAMLNPEQRFIVEIVKALAADPLVLVLDEPTEHLLSEDVARLFERIRAVAARGACVVYISHRIREVQAIADRITVLRDGTWQGTFTASTLSEDEIVTLVVGASLDREFPAKMSGASSGVAVEVRNLSGRGFTDVSISVGRGEILGLAGIDGNGQLEFLRALAGLTASMGSIALNGRTISVRDASAAAAAGIRYLPGDRHREGIFAELAVRENFSIRNPTDNARLGVMRVGQEQRRVMQAISNFAIKTPSPEVPIRLLSGGNQQKVVLASVLDSQPEIILVHEPTQGVDVGARAEIYQILREAARAGRTVLILSSDAQEVAGLSDRVLVFSRGRVVETLSGANVSEGNITSAVLKSTSQRENAHRQVAPFWVWASGNTAPLVMVAAAVLLMGMMAGLANPFYLTPRSISGMMTLAATLALVAYGQQLLMLVGGIDLSVGPLMGLVQVIASFYLLPALPPEHQAIGIAVILLASLLVGLLNWTLVDPLGLHPMVATLATYMALQAISLVLRPVPAGMFDADITGAIGFKLAAVPVTMIVAVVLALVLEFLLYRSRAGLNFRGLGSWQEAARIAGIRPRLTRLLAYTGCSLLAGVAGIALTQQIGIGDPRAGLGYTLTSIAAVAIGGASLFGARGSFIGALLGAAFITQVNSVTSFLALDQAWQSYLLGAMIIAAVALYSKSRQMVVAL